ncbi:MAG: hypothetical protein NTX73_19830 [Rhodobacterales bacterium]|nr:hypothetical protein [Rhodobacterales bacterium]
MDKDIALKLGKLGAAELSAVLSFMQSDLSRLANATVKELARINRSGDVRETHRSD